MNKLLHTAIDTFVLYQRYLRFQLSRPGRLRRRTGRLGSEVLLLAWAMPPSITGGVYRPLSLVQAFAAAGWGTEVISGPLPRRITEAGELLAAGFPDAARLHRLGAPSLEPSYRFSPRIDGGFVNALDTITLAESERIGDVDLVIASGPPFHNFVAAYFLARLHGSRLVLDYRDEWTECPFPFVRKGNLDRYWERRCLAAADLVVFATERFREHHLQTFSTLQAQRTAVVYNGWEADTTQPQRDHSATRNPGDGRLIVSFTGFLGPHTLPDDFFVTLASVLDRNVMLRERLLVRFIGEKSPEGRAVLESFRYPALLESIDHQPKWQAVQSIAESDAVLLIASEDLARYVPGKFFDYMAHGPAILVYGVPGEVHDVVTATAAGLVVAPGDDEALEKALLELCDAGSEHWRNETRAQWSREHTREISAQRFFDAVRPLVS